MQYNIGQNICYHFHYSNIKLKEIDIKHILQMESNGQLKKN